MKTGFGIVADENDLDETLLKRISSILSYFMTKAIEVGVVYSKEAGRDMVTSTDIIYALEYQAQHFTDAANDECLEETLTNIEHEMESDPDSESDSESDSEEEEPFTRAESDDPVVTEMNRCHDTWGEWAPQDDIQAMIKRAVDHVKTTL